MDEHNLHNIFFSSIFLYHNHTKFICMETAEILNLACKIGVFLTDA